MEVGVSAHRVRIHIDREPFESPNPTTGEALYVLGSVAEHHDLFREVGGDKEDELIERNAREVHLEPDTHFYSQKVITIFVDGEPYPAPRREMTPNEIIRLGAEKDPATNYLVRIKPHESYKGRGDVPIHLHNDESFQVISTGPTPVSDPQMRTGLAVFMEGLKALGYEPVQSAQEPGCVVIDYVVPVGKFAGRQVKHGFVVPAGFPMTPPSGPHVWPEIHRINPNGVHPTGHVHKSHSEPFDRAFGGGWQYWSRPFPGWPQSKRSVAAYMNYVVQLWETQ